MLQVISKLLLSSLDKTPFNYTGHQPQWWTKTTSKSSTRSLFQR